MKVLNFYGEQLKAEKIIKNIDNIIGTDTYGNNVFSIYGIKDFSGINISNEDGTSCDYDIKKPSLEEKNRSDIDYIMIMQGL
jgi:hypothetical protein